VIDWINIRVPLEYSIEWYPLFSRSGW